MPRSFSVWPLNNVGAAVRLAVLILLAANLVAAYFVIRPPGGSPEELAERLAELRVRLQQQKGTLERTKKLAAKVESGRSEGDEFLDSYFLSRRTAYSDIVAELVKDAAEAKITPKETAFASQQIEGSETFSMLQVSANYEGKYGDIIHFINLLDRSDLLLIIESLNATPQMGSGLLSVTLKLDAFVREDGSGQ